MISTYLLGFAALGAINYFSLAGSSEEEALTTFVLWIGVSSMTMMIQGTDMFKMESLATLVLFRTMPMLSCISVGWISAFALLLRLYLDPFEAEEEDDDDDEEERDDERTKRRQFIRRTVISKIVSADVVEEEDCCAICLGEYKEGEIVCRSRNEKCHHAFHLPCVEEWLSRRSKCPCCRSVYLLQDDSTSLSRSPTGVVSALMPPKKR